MGIQPVQQRVLRNDKVIARTLLGFVLAQNVKFKKQRGASGK